MAIYDNVKEVCKEQGITVSELEEKLNFARSSIYKWNRHLPSVEKLRAVAEYLDRPMEYFLESTGRQEKDEQEAVDNSELKSI